MNKQENNTVLFFSCMLLVVGLFSIDLYNPSLPSITRAFHETKAFARDLIIAYLTGFSLSQLVYGPISDSEGRKKVIIVSLAFTVMGNLLTATASSGDELILYRFLTGVGAGGCPVISRAIIRDCFHEKQTLTRAFSIFSMASQISPAIAPVIGGFIEQYYIWRLNFVVLSVITAIVFITVLLFFRETSLRKNTLRISGILADYKNILSERRFLCYSSLSALVFSLTITYYTVNPFIFQLEYGFGSFGNSLVYVLYSAGLFTGSYTMKKLISYSSPENILYKGLGGLIVTPWMMVIFSYYIHHAFIIISFSLVLAILCGLCAPILISMSVFPFPEKSGTASTLQGTIKMAGTAITLLLLARFHINDDASISIALSVISALMIPLVCIVRKNELGN